MLDFESVPHAPDRLNVLRFLGVQLNLLANLFDMHGHGRDIADGLHIPDIREQLLFAEYPVGILREER